MVEQIEKQQMLVLLVHDLDIRNQSWKSPDFDAVFSSFCPW